jgi:hypothetical protein
MDKLVNDFKDLKAIAAIVREIGPSDVWLLEKYSQGANGQEIIDRYLCSGRDPNENKKHCELKYGGNATYTLDENGFVEDHKRLVISEIGSGGKKSLTFFPKACTIYNANEDVESENFWLIVSPSTEIPRYYYIMKEETTEVHVVELDSVRAAEAAGVDPIPYLAAHLAEPCAIGGCR